MNKRLVLHDHASMSDEREVALEQVGVHGLRYPVTVLDRNAGYQTTVAEVAASVDVPATVKGTHMSRFIEVIDEHHREITADTLPGILDEMQRRLAASNAFLELEFPYFIRKRAPVSGYESLMDYRCRFEAALHGETFDFVLGAQIPVKSLCPCSKAISERGAHNQRSIIDVRIRFDHHVWLEDLIATVESCGSSPLFALLKRDDEKYVTELAYDNPRFVEDLAREVVVRVRQLPGVHWISVFVDNHESIHNHAAFARTSWTRASQGRP